MSSESTDDCEAADESEDERGAGDGALTLDFFEVAAIVVVE